MYHKHPGELTTAKEVCDRYKTSFDAMAKVMQQLAQKGVLKSEQGARGGYLLQKDLSRFSFFELVKFVEGPVGVVKCLHQASEQSCELMNTCNIVSPAQFINKKLIHFYESLMVDEILNSKPRGSAHSSLGLSNNVVDHGLEKVRGEISGELRNV